MLHAFFYKNSVSSLNVRYSYNLAKYKGEIFLMYSYFSEYNFCENFTCTQETTISRLLKTAEYV